MYALKEVSSRIGSDTTLVIFKLNGFSTTISIINKQTINNKIYFVTTKH